MKKKVVYLIISISTLALLGILFTQTYWVKESYNLNEEQYANSVRIALKGVANQMLNYENNRIKKIMVNNSGDKDIPVPVVENINPGLLDFKISEEFNCMQIGKNYAYAIINLETGKVLMGKYEGYTRELFNSAHQIPMTGFQDSDHISLAAYFPHQRNMLLMRMINWLILSMIFALLLGLSLYFTLYSIFRQKKLSEMKSDFINNLTHEFKTPLATISLAAEMLTKDNINKDPCKTGRYAKIILAENTRLRSQVEQILNISPMERGELKLKLRDIDIHELIIKTASSFKMIIRNRNGSLKKELKAVNPILKVDKTHITNVISNLLDNANKYSPESPEVVISTKNTSDGIIISVTDKGIGISRENQKNIFKNFYRVPTGNIYNVQGFGIGLYYVKNVVEAHGGSINLWSEPLKGSRFDVYLPFVSKSSYDERD